MRKFRSKPCVTEAVQLLNDIESARSVAWMCGGEAQARSQKAEPWKFSVSFQQDGEWLAVHPGDWVIRDREGTLHVWPDEVFQERYEPEVEATEETHEFRIQVRGDKDGEWLTNSHPLPTRPGRNTMLGTNPESFRVICRPKEAAWEVYDGWKTRP